MSINTGENLGKKESKTLLVRRETTTSPWKPEKVPKTTLKLNPPYDPLLGFHWESDSTA